MVEHIMVEHIMVEHLQFAIAYHSSPNNYIDFTGL